MGAEGVVDGADDVGVTLLNPSLTCSLIVFTELLTVSPILLTVFDTLPTASFTVFCALLTFSDNDPTPSFIISLELSIKPLP